MHQFESGYSEMGFFLYKDTYRLFGFKGLTLHSGIK